MTARRIEITDDIKLTLLGVVQVKQRTRACDWGISPHETAPPQTFFISASKSILAIKGCPCIEPGGWQGADKLKRKKESC